MALFKEMMERIETVQVEMFTRMLEEAFVLVGDKYGLEMDDETNREIYETVFNNINIPSAKTQKPLKKTAATTKEKKEKADKPATTKDKAKEKATTKKTDKADTIKLPFCMEPINHNLCYGLEHCYGQYKQCTMVKKVGDYCGKCGKQADANENGKPKKGTIQDRHECGLFGYVEPNGKDKQEPYLKYMKANGLTADMVREEAESKGLVVDERHFTEGGAVAPTKRKNTNKHTKEEEEADSDDEAPVPAPAPKKKATATKKKPVVDDLDEFLSKKKTTAAVKSDDEEEVVKGFDSDDEEESFDAPPPAPKVAPPAPKAVATKAAAVAPPPTKATAVATKAAAVATKAAAVAPPPQQEEELEEGEEEEEKGSGNEEEGSDDEEEGSDDEEEGSDDDDGVSVVEVVEDEIVDGTIIKAQNNTKVFRLSKNVNTDEETWVHKTKTTDKYTNVKGVLYHKKYYKLNSKTGVMVRF
jgi:hypothetical protein